MAFIKLPDERPANGPLTLASFEEEKRWRGKGASISGLSFPPLATQFNPSGSQASWPGLEYTRRTRLKTHLDPATNMSYHLNIVTGESRWDEPVESAATATATATTATEGQRRASHRHERRTSKLITPVCASKKRIDWSPSSVNLPSSAAPDLRRSKADVPGAAAEGILGEEHPAPRDATKIGLQQSQPPHPPQRLGGMVQHHSSRALNEEDDFL